MLCFSSRGALWRLGAGAGLALGVLCGRELSVRGALSVCDGDGERDALDEPLPAALGRLLFSMRLLFDMLLLLTGADGRLAAFEPVEAGRFAAEGVTRASLGEMAGA